LEEGEKTTMKITRFLFAFATCLLLTAACNSEDFGQTSEALMSTYRIGNATTVAGTTPTAITFVYQSLPYIPSPSFKPEAGTSFVQSFSIGNGGYHLSNGQGNLNKLTFRIYQVVLANGTAYFAATADVWKADATGHTTLTSNVLTVTAWFKWRFELYWQDGVLSFYVYDQLWHYKMSGCLPPDTAPGRRCARETKPRYGPLG